jgi:hypothetical protein
MIRARHAGFDQKWRGDAVDLSSNGSSVGAPVVASEPGHVVAGSGRTKASDPWKVVIVDVLPGGGVKSSELPTGSGARTRDLEHCRPWLLRAVMGRRKRLRRRRPLQPRSFEGYSHMTSMKRRQVPPLHVVNSSQV